MGRELLLAVLLHACLPSYMFACFLLCVCFSLFSRAVCSGGPVFENYVAELTVDGVPIELSLWDTAGQEDYDRLRPLSYTDTDVVLVCYCLTRPETLKNVDLRWRQEVRHFCPETPVILVGTKCDLKETEGSCSALDVQNAARAIGAIASLECSALTRAGVNTVFETASREVTKKRATQTKPGGNGKKKCVIL